MAMARARARGWSYSRARARGGASFLTDSHIGCLPIAILIRGYHIVQILSGSHQVVNEPGDSATIGSWA